jgi:hypothetical protein
MTASGIFAALWLPSPITSLGDFGTLLVQKLVTAIGAEELDLLVPQLLGMTIKLPFALWAGHPKNFCHVCLVVLYRRGAEFSEIGIFLNEKTFFSALSAPPR